jgi:hypothetical protein
MADEQDITEARERVNALRRQIRAEQNDRAVASVEAARDAQLDALSEEERMLEAQLSEIRTTQRAGAPEVVVPAEPGEGNVNVMGGPVRGDEDPHAAGEVVPGDGVGFREFVDARGRLVREPLNAENAEQSVVTDDSTVQLADPNAGPPVAAHETDTPAVDGVEPNPEDVGTREADQVPPADATTARPNRRR